MAAAGVAVTWARIRVRTPVNGMSRGLVPAAAAARAAAVAVVVDQQQRQALAGVGDCRAARGGRRGRSRCRKAVSTAYRSRGPRSGPGTPRGQQGGQDPQERGPSPRVRAVTVKVTSLAAVSAALRGPVSRRRRVRAADVQRPVAVGQGADGRRGRTRAVRRARPGPRRWRRTAATGPGEEPAVGEVSPAGTWPSGAGRRRRVAASAAPTTGRWRCGVRGGPQQRPRVRGRRTRPARRGQHVGASAVTQAHSTVSQLSVGRRAARRSDRREQPGGRTRWAAPAGEPRPGSRTRLSTVVASAGNRHATRTRSR